MVESIETVVIGAGHAGLSASYILKKRGLEHLILEKAGQPGNSWRQRWDSLTFVSPNWSFQIPGGEYDGPDPDGFMTRDELVGRLETYAVQNQLPIAYNSCVNSVQLANGNGYLIRMQDKDYQARNVIVANGYFQAPKLPAFTSKIPPSILQLHSGSYRNPQSLPDGTVLVGGSGQSGAQIAEELYQSGRKVYLATGSAPHAPRRYRGTDTFKWMVDSGFVDQPFEKMAQGRHFVAPMFSGKNGGHALNLHQFYRDGVILVGHALDYVDGKLILAPDLKENLGKADNAQKGMLKNIDDYIQRAGIDAPREDLPVMMDAYQAAEVTSLDLHAEGINTIIWATGYSYDASVFQFPVLTPLGLPDAPSGISDTHPGVYFVGFPLPSLRSAFLVGIAKNSALIAEKITGQRKM